MDENMEQTFKVDFGVFIIAIFDMVFIKLPLDGALEIFKNIFSRV